MNAPLSVSCPTVVSFAVRFLGTTLITLAFLAGCANPLPVTPPEVENQATPQVVFVPVPMTVEVTPAGGDAAAPATPVLQGPCPLTSLNLTDRIVVGAILPLSYPASMLTALNIQAALTLAVERVNAAGGAGGKPIRLVTYDSGGDPSQALRAAVELITEECAVALVGGVHGDASMRILEAAHRYGAPFLAIGPLDAELTATNYREIFRLTASGEQLSAAFGDWMTEVGDFNGDGRSFAIIVAENSSTGELHAQIVARGLDAAGIDNETFSVDLPTQDFSSVIARIVARDTAPDAIFIRLTTDAALELQRQLLDNGIGPLKKSLIVTSRSALVGNQFWQRMGQQGLYTVVTRIGAWPPTTNDEGLAFAQEFQRLLGRWPDEASFAAFDSIWLVADAINRSAPDLGTLVGAMETTQMQLANGFYSFPVGAMRPGDQVRIPLALQRQVEHPATLFLQYTEVNQDPSQMAVLWPPIYQTDNTALIRP